MIVCAVALATCLIFSILGRGFHATVETGDAILELKTNSGLLSYLVPRCIVLSKVLAGGEKQAVICSGGKQNSIMLGEFLINLLKMCTLIFGRSHKVLIILGLTLIELIFVLYEIQELEMRGDPRLENTFVGVLNCFVSIAQLATWIIELHLGLVSE